MCRLRVRHLPGRRSQPEIMELAAPTACSRRSRLLITRYLADRDKKLRIEPIDPTLVRFVSTLTDTFRSPAGDDLIHALRLEGTISLPDLVIRSIEATSTEQPFDACAASVDPMRKLVGVRIGPGFRNQVMERIGGVRGCTHYLSMALDLGASHTLTTYLQMEVEAPRRGEGADDGRWIAVGLRIEPRLENACIGLKSESPVIVSARRHLGKR